MCLRRFKNKSERSERVKYFSTRQEKFRVSKRLCSAPFITYINQHQWNKKLSAIAAKGAIYYVTITTGDLFTLNDSMLFSRVKTSRFRENAHLVFH